MKFLSEYRDADLAKKYLDEIFSLKSLKWENVKDIESVKLSLIKSEQYVGRNNSGILLKNQQPTRPAARCVG